MLRALAILTLLVPATAMADEPDHEADLAYDYTRTARDAARAGNCDVVAEIAPKVAALHPEYYAETFVLEPSIAACMDPDPARRPQPRLLRQPPMPPQPTQFIMVPGPRSRPPLSGPRVASEVLAGALVGSGGAFVGGLIGIAVCASGGADFDCTDIALVAVYGGGLFGFASGVYLAGSYGDQQGSFGATLGGGALGGFVGLLQLARTDESRGGNDTMAIAVLVALPMIGSIAGFNMTRRYEPRRVPTGSLLQLDGGGLSLGVPLIMHGESFGAPTTNVSLLAGSF